MNWIGSIGHRSWLNVANNPSRHAARSWSERFARYQCSDDPRARAVEYHIRRGHRAHQWEAAHCMHQISKGPQRREHRFSCLPITLFELRYGVATSSRREFNKNPLEIFLAGPVHQLPFERAHAELAGAIRADLESVGKPIRAYDVFDCRVGDA